MKISARNKLKGRIVEVKKGATTAHVKIDIGGQMVTAAITNEFGRGAEPRAGANGLCGRQGERRHGRDRLD